jgi:ABC-type antimicrobial peptide transport system permease subunit
LALKLILLRKINKHVYQLTFEELDKYYVMRIHRLKDGWSFQKHGMPFGTLWQAAVMLKMWLNNLWRRGS